MTSNPLDDLRKINRDQRNAQEPPVPTALRETVSTGVRTGGSTEGGTPGRSEGRKALRKQVRPAVPPSLPEAALPSLSTEGLPDLREAVRQTVTEKRIYQGGVKATIDLSPELSTRFKRYSIDHSNVTLRQMLTELLDAYLEGEGY